MVEGNAAMYLGSPRMAEMVIGEKVTLEEMGGAKMHCSVSGCGDVLVKTEDDAIAWAKRYFAYMPQNHGEMPAIGEPVAPDASGKTLEQIIPADENKPFNMFHLLREVVDRDSLVEVKKLFAQEMITAFARIDGQPVGIVANQPAFLAGCLDIDSSVKGARFVRFCDAFNIPLITFEDVPGFLPGTEQEFGGIIRHGAKLLYAYAEATVPKITVITRKAYGGAYCVMGSKHLRTDVNLAWPTAEIAVMGAEGAVNIVYRRELNGAGPELRAAKIAEFNDRFASPFVAAEHGYIDDVIEPRETRTRLIKSLRMLETKVDTMPRKKHGNIPL